MVSMGINRKWSEISVGVGVSTGSGLGLMWGCGCQPKVVWNWYGSYVGVLGSAGSGLRLV